MRNPFKKSEPPPDPLAEEARANLPILEEFRGTVGWGLVKGWCVGEANNAIIEWTQGVPHERQLALATRVTTLGWLVDLIENRIVLYRKVLENSGEIPESQGSKEEDKPFVDPFEPVEEL